jgi:hypothetical protein
VVERVFLSFLLAPPTPLLVVELLTSLEFVVFGIHLGRIGLLQVKAADQRDRAGDKAAESTAARA